MIYSSKSALPSEWDKRQWGRHQAAQQYLKVDGLTVKYTGPGETDAQAASIFADHAVPQDVPLYYFEITVVNKGAQGFIGIGFCSEDVNLGRLPGWEPHSYGYHGDDGHAFHGSGTGRAFGPGFTTGDVVGALLDRGLNTISFFKNGEPVGTAFYGVQEPQLYPCVGMRTANEEIRANFGATPFAVDFAALQQQFRQRILDSISAVKLPAAVDLAASPAAAVAAAGGGSGGGAAAAANTPSTSSRRSAAAAAEGGSGGGGEAAATAAGALQPAAHVLLAAMGQAAAAAAQEGETADGAAAAADADAGSSKPSGSSKASSYSQPLLPYLIFDYLLHQRCWRTAAVVARDMLEGPVKASTAAAAAARPIGDAAAPMECSSGEDTGMPDAAAAAAAAAAATSGTPADAAAAAGTGAAGGLSEAAIQDALTRQQIFDAVAAGQLSDALQQVEQHFGPAVLQGNPKLAFKLKVQQFVELVRQATSGSSAAAAAAAAANGSKTVAAAAGVGGFEAALAYGRAELGPGSKSPDEEELLSDALSLLAYADPAASPCGHLLRVGQRLQLAEELNGALLQARGTSAQPLLESIYRQAVVLLDELKRQGTPSAVVLDVPALCLKGPPAGQQKTQRKGQQAGSSAAAAAGAASSAQE